jgi:hypothetical protein
MNSLFNDESKELEELRAENARLRALQEAIPPAKSAEAVRVGVHSSDKPRSFSEWMKFKKQAGHAVWTSTKVQQQVLRDREQLGEQAFYGTD